MYLRNTGKENQNSLLIILRCRLFCCYKEPELKSVVHSHITYYEKTSTKTAVSNKLE